MSDAWEPLNPNADKFLDVLEGITDVLDPVLSVLSDIISIIEAAAKFVAAVDSLISRTLQEIKNLLLGIIQDILAANLSACFHHNVVWDDDWSWAPKKFLQTLEEDLPARNRNYTEDGQLPWTATGLNGWLDDIYASAMNPENIKAPKTDGDDEIFALFVIFGFPDVSAFMSMPNALKEFLKTLNIKFATDGWDRMKASYEKGNARLEAAFSFEDGLITSGWAVDDTVFTGENPTGDLPAWLSLTLANFLGPASANLFKIISNAIDALDDYSSLSGIVLMIESLAKKVRVLEDLVKKIDRAIETLIAILEAITNLGHVLAIKSTTGMAGVIQGAKNADNYPDFGAKGAVAGLCFAGASNAGNVTDKFEKLLALFGIGLDEGETTDFVNNLNAASTELNVQTSSGTFANV